MAPFVDESKLELGIDTMRCFGYLSCIRPLLILVFFAVFGANAMATVSSVEAPKKDCPRYIAKVGESDNYKQPLDYVMRLEPKITDPYKLVTYLLENGVPVKVIAADTQYSLAHVYNWRSGHGGISPRAFEYLLAQFDLIYPVARQRELEAKRLSAGLVSIVQELYPDLRDLIKKPQDIADVLTPVRRQRGKEFPREAILAWSEQNIPISDADSIKVAHLMLGQSKEELQKLRYEYLARREMLGHEYNPKLSIIGNMTKAGYAKLDRLNRDRAQLYRPIDVLDALLQHSRTLVVRDEIALRKHELLRFIMMDAQTVNAWQARRVRMGEHHLLPLMLLFNALNSGRVDDVAALLKIDSARASEILQFQYQ